MTLHTFKKFAALNENSNVQALLDLVDAEGVGALTSSQKRYLDDHFTTGKVADEKDAQVKKGDIFHLGGSSFRYEHTQPGLGTDITHFGFFDAYPITIDCRADGSFKHVDLGDENEDNMTSSEIARIERFFAKVVCPRLPTETPSRMKQW